MAGGSTLGRFLTEIVIFHATALVNDSSNAFKNAAEHCKVNVNANTAKVSRMSLTPYHAKYFAHELTRRCSSDNVDKLAGAVASAQVDLNPHQVDAALFAFNSPLAKGALLADEVGLGKTIEAGLVLRSEERRVGKE